MGATTQVTEVGAVDRQHHRPNRTDPGQGASRAALEPVTNPWNTALFDV
jgi:hypothetical protein